jgi:hypothetical protein
MAGEDGSNIFMPRMMSSKGEQGKQTSPDDLHSAATNLLKSARDSMEAIAAGKTVSAFFNPPTDGGGNMATETTKQMMTMFGGLSNTLMGMVELERSARVAAEQSSNQAMGDYLKLLANQAKDLQARFQSVQPPAPLTLQDKIQEMQTITDMVNSNAARIAKEVLATTQPLTSKSGYSQVDVDLKKLELGQATAIEQMRQTHEIAMRNLDLQLKRLDLEALQWKQGQANKQSWFEDIMGSVGRAFMQGAATGQAEQAAGSYQPGQVPLQATPVPEPPPRTQAGLIPVECTNPGCGVKFAVVPGMPKVQCPSCGTEYDVSDL